MADADRLAERMAQSAEAFSLVKIKGLSLRDAADKMGVSHETVRTLVKAHTAYLKDDRTLDKDERRAAFEALVSELQKRAFETYDAAPSGKTLSRVAALNTIVALLPHLRAVQGLDEPKEARVDADVKHTVVWDDSAMDGE